MNRVIKSAYADASSASAPYLLRPDDLLNGMGGAESDIQDIVSRAKQQVDMILRTARAEAKALLDQAYEDGRRLGAQQAAGAASDLINRLESDILEVAEERAGLVKSVEEQVLMLSIEAAEKIIRHEIKTDPSTVARTIQLCLRRVRDRDEVTVRVSPSEVAAVRAMRDELLGSAEGIRGLSIVDDRRVSAGGCVVEASSGDLDAKIETQIEELRRKLMDVLANELNKSS